MAPRRSGSLGSAPGGPGTDRAAGGVPSRLTPQGPVYTLLAAVMLGERGADAIPMSISEKEKALELALMQIEKAHGKGSIMRLGEASAKLNVEVIPTGSLALDIALGVGGIPRGAGRRDLRAGIVGKNDAGAPCHRGGPKARGHRGRHRRGACARSQLRWKTRCRCGQPPDLAARQRRKRS